MQKSEYVEPGIAAVEADGSYLERMLTETQIWPEITIPGWAEPVRIRPLGRGVEQQCHAKAARWVKGLGFSIDKPKDTENAPGHEMYGERAAALILYEALVTADSNPNNPRAAKPLAETFEVFINHPSISDTFLSYAWDEYENAKRACSPYIEDLPVAVRAEIVEGLKKNPTGMSFSELPRNWLEDCLRFTGTLLAASTGSKSSTTSSSSE